MRIKELREKRARAIEDARAFVEQRTAKGEALSADDKAKVDAMRADIAALKATIEAAEELDAEDRAIVPASQAAAEERARVERDHPDQATENRAREAALDRFLRAQTPKPEDLRYLGVSAEFRDQGLTGNVGGYTVAPNVSFYGQIKDAELYFSGMDQAGCTILNTSTGADLPIPTDDDTANSGIIVAEAGSHASGTDVSLAQVTLKAYVLSSKIVKVSWQLMQDSAFDFGAFLARKLGQRLGRGRNTYLTTGTGSSQPLGVDYSPTVGVTGATGFTTAVAADDIIKLIHSVDVAYRGPACKFMMHDLTAQAIELLKDGDGQYLFKPGLTEGASDRLRGYPIVINNSMPQMATSAKSILFGDFSSYFIRNVAGIQLVRLNELYAANGQVGFLAFERFDGGPVDAGQHPIKCFANSAS